MAMQMECLLRWTIAASEKSAALARSIRAEEKLFSLLVQEKGSLERNPRFQVDFKTLADVLIQETMRHDLDIKFPGLGNRLYGEESNKFTNVLGETITVKVCDDCDSTAQLLEAILDDNHEAAVLLSKIVHTDVAEFELLEDSSLFEPLQGRSVAIDNIALWIDPIDGTCEYITGIWQNPESNNCVRKSGLTNVTVLIGAFDITNGLPFLGVVNQPFHAVDQSDLNKWTGNMHWGVCLPELRVTNLPPAASTTSVKTSFSVVVSDGEMEDLAEVLNPQTFQLTSASGAGYKMLCVLEASVDAYLLRKASTYQWDSCGPHAILRAMGGGVLRLADALDSSSPLDQLQLTYLQAVSTAGVSIDRYCNKTGLLAYRDVGVMERILEALRAVQKE